MGKCWQKPVIGSAHCAVFGVAAGSFAVELVTCTHTRALQPDKQAIVDCAYMLHIISMGRAHHFSRFTRSSSPVALCYTSKLSTHENSLPFWLLAWKLAKNGRFWSVSSDLYS